MEGFNFGVPATFVTYLTIGLGTLFVLRALFIIIRDRIKGKQWRVPAALIPFTASVGIEFIGTVVLSRIPYHLLQSRILGWNLVSFVWSSFLIGSFAFVLLSVVLVRWDSGPAKHTVQMGSTTLLVVAVLGFIWYVA
jgi:hypothetical protein